MAELLIVLVNYRRPDDTIACIESLSRSSFRDFDIIVIDNASGDGSADRLRTRYPGLRVVANTQNTGFAAGNNIGLEAFRKGAYSLVLLLNNDTEVDPEALTALVAAARARPGAGIVGAKIFYHAQPSILWFAGGTLNPKSGSVSHRGLLEPDNGQYDRPEPCDFVTGCCMLIRRDVVERIGDLDTAYFAYFEDADFCLRARRAGFDVRYEPGARIWHKVSSTAQWDSPVYLYFTLRNRLILLRKHSTVLASLPYAPYLLYYYGRQFLRLLVKWRDLQGTRAAWFALIDGLRGSTGTLGRGRIDRVTGAAGGSSPASSTASGFR